MAWKNASDEVEGVRQQYKTETNLSIRSRTHELYTQPKTNFITWILDHVNWTGNERVVDVGCGSGNYVEAVLQRTPHYIAADYSMGMLQSLTRPGLSRLNLDAHQLPLASNSADVVLANHMIYHLPDKPKAIAEFRRILRPGGVLLAATNSKQSMRELNELRLLVQQTYDMPLADPILAYELTYTLEDGAEWLSPHFEQVTRHDLPGALVFPAPEPVIDYLGTTRAKYEEFLPAGKTWQDIRDLLYPHLQQHIQENGHFTVNKLTGVFVCRVE